MNQVLCRLPNHIGDCCMCLPALRLLQASGYKPMLFGKHWAEDLFGGMGWQFDPITGRILKDWTHVRYVRRYADHVRTALLFPNSIGSAVLFRMAGAKPAGLRTDCRSLLLDVKIPEPGPMHETERFFYVAHEAIKAWGGTPAFDEVPRNLGLVLLKRHEAAARNILRQHALTRPYVLIAPVAKGLHKGKVKEWPYYAQIIEPLRELGVEPVVIPTRDEEAHARENCPGATFLPETTLGNFAALAKRARLVIANDSGVSHIAASVGARQMTLIGVTDPSRTSPWNARNINMGKDGEWASADAVIDELRKMLRA